MQQNTRLIIFLAILLAILIVLLLATTAEATTRIPPMGRDSYCCAAFKDEIRPPLWWNGKLINRKLPAWCRRTCGRRR